MLLLTSCVSLGKYRNCRSELLGSEREMAELQARANALGVYSESLLVLCDSLQSELQGVQNDGRLAEMEQMLSARDAELRRMHDLINSALYDFRDSGVEVYERDGVLYISMQDKLLFESGKAELAESGVKALGRVSGVLTQNTKFDITVQGHTDNKGYIAKAGAQIVDNWDLSVKRATEVVRVLRRDGLSGERIIASGRAQYSPVASNSDERGRALNRRTEIMITPQFTQLIKLLNNKINQ